MSLILLIPSNINLFVIAQNHVIFPIRLKFNHSLKNSSVGTTLEKDLVKLFEIFKKGDLISLLFLSKSKYQPFEKKDSTEFIGFLILKIKQFGLSFFDNYSTP